VIRLYGAESSRTLADSAPRAEGHPLPGALSLILLKILIIGLSSGRRIALPMEDVPELSKATENVL
jgi:hypothetical protein